LLLLLLARLLLTTAALLLIALIGHQVAPWFDKKENARTGQTFLRNAMANRRFPINGRLGTTASLRIQNCCWRVTFLPSNAPPVAAWTGLPSTT